MKSKLFLFLTPLFLALSIHAAPPLISYSGQVTVDGQPYTGTGFFKFAFVDANGQFSYWSHDGTSTAGSEPTGQVSVPVNAGLYSVMLGDTTLTGMSAFAESIFDNHNDVHLRIWFSDGLGFEQLTPDRRFASVPYSLGANGTSTANLVSTGSGSSAGDSNSSTTNIHNYNFGGPLGMGHARLVADGPDNPSTTLVLLTGDSAEIASYVADKPGRLKYAFDAFTISLPRGEDSLLSEQSTLIGPGSIRLTAPTGVVNVAILKVNRASGRDPNKIQGSPAPGSTAPAPAPAIVSVPQTRSVARGGTTTLFASASGDNLSYQWKKNGVDIAGATSAGLPLQNATGAVEGNYTVVISNAEGNVTSAPIMVAVEMPAIPAGVYRINNSNGATGHEVALTGFSIDQHEVPKSFWDEVYTWAIANGYTFTNEGIADGPSHPVHSINWYDCVKWANALSERDGHTPCYYTDDNCTQVYRTGEVDLTNYNVRWNVDGYRLPTESEWEVAARGGLEGSKYAWGEAPSSSKANFDQSLHGSTLEVGSYSETGYGLFEIGGNLREWVWDWKNITDTYAYEFKDVVYHSSSGSTGFLNASETNSTWDLLETDPFGISSNTSSDTDILVRSFTPSDMGTKLVKNVGLKLSHSSTSSYRNARASAFFYYEDETSSNTSKFVSGTSPLWKYLENPNPSKNLTKIDLFLRTYESPGYIGDYTGYISSVNIGNAYSNRINISKVSFDLPDYKEFKTYFSVDVDVLREGNDDVWFDLIDINGSKKTYNNSDFGKTLPITYPISVPKRLEIYLQPKFPSSKKGGTSLQAVYWKTNDPKSFVTGNERVVRDNHYGEELQHLSNRNFSSPASRSSTVGFRLVQRP
jgi:formylglycine-generating enzyme required for sulfatase activity